MSHSLTLGHFLAPTNLHLDPAILRCASGLYLTHLQTLKFRCHPGSPFQRGCLRGLLVAVLVTGESDSQGYAPLFFGSLYLPGFDVALTLASSGVRGRVYGHS